MSEAIYPKEWDDIKTSEPQIEIINEEPETVTVPQKLVLPINLKSDLCDAWNAQMFLSVFGKNVRYRRETIQDKGGQGWSVWNGCKWDAQAGHKAVEAFLSLVPLLEEDAGKILESIDDEKVQHTTDTTICRHFKYLRSAHGIRAGLFLASQDSRVNKSLNDFDSKPYLLNLQNGTLDFHTHQLRPHRRADLITKYIDIPYNPDADCPRWEQFVAEIMCEDMELVDYLQRAAGYSITGCTDEELMFVLYGGGANGKSVFLRVLHDILGDYARQGSQDMLTSMSMPDGDKANVSIANLRGAYFVALSETRQNAKLQENLVKQLTGNDPITARRMYENYSTFMPHFKLWLATNHKPTIGDTGLGMWRRLKLIPFNATFDLDKQDDKLYEKLMREKEGILAWLVRGELMRQERPLKRYEAESVTESTAEYRSEMDKIQLFLDECTTSPQSPDDCLSIEKCYELYKDWCEDAGEKPLTKRYLGLRLKDKGYNQDRRGKDRTRYWCGLAEKTDK